MDHYVGPRTIRWTISIICSPSKQKKECKSGPPIRKTCQTILAICYGTLITKMSLHLYDVNVRLLQCIVTLEISMTSNIVQCGTRIGTENRHRIGPLPCSIYKFDMTSVYIFSIIDLGKSAPQANKLSLLREKKLSAVEIEIQRNSLETFRF